MNIDLTRKNSRNLSVLSTIDKNIVEIIAEASHVAVYEYESSPQSWKRYNVEGASFIVRRNVSADNYAHSYLLIVLNKQGLDNLGGLSSLLLLLSISICDNL